MNNEDLLELSHNHINGYIKVADQKASILLSGQLAFLALSLNLIPSKWGNLHVTLLILICLTLLVISSSILFSILTVLPREGSDGKEGAIYWNDIRAHGNSDQFVQYVSQLDEDAVVQELGEDVYNISKIAKRKYEYLKISIILTVIFLLLSLVTIGMCIV